jgi:methyl-accepting chemotaxis protein
MTLAISFMSWFNITNLVKQEFIAIPKNLYQESKGIGDKVGLLFYERYGDVQAFAKNNIFLEYEGSTTHLQEEVSLIFNEYVKLYGVYDLIVFVNTKGEVISTNTIDSQGKNLPLAKNSWGKSLSQQEWVQKVTEGKFTEDTSKGFSGTLVEGFQKNEMAQNIYGEPKWGSSFSAIAKTKTGETIGYLQAFAERRWIQSVLDGHILSFDDSHNSNSEYLILDGQYRPIAVFEGNLYTQKISQNVKNFIFANLTNEKNYPSLRLAEGKHGGEFYKSEYGNKEGLISGYSKITNNKFIDSLGWSVISTLKDQEALKHINHEKRNFYIISIIMQLLSILFSQLFANSVSKSLRKTADELVTETNQLLDISQKLNYSGEKLSRGTTEQSTSLHETVSAIEEVNAMVTKNADNAKKSHQLSLQSSEVANKGKKSVEEMIQSIEDIQKSNIDIMKQIESSNQEISSIVKVINDIGQKTKVINDIVFQTKLLSFNASVEAARAGEHGKGFAVVAEEVGNLAQMSGNAAKEISQLLEGSTQKVEHIVNDTKTKVERLTVEGKHKVEMGTIKAKNCGEVLEEIVTNVNNMTLMVAEISTASEEQSLGVQEINKAMIRMDQVTKENVEAATETAEAAQVLKKHAGLIEGCSKDLFKTIEGVHTNHKKSMDNGSGDHTSSHQNTRSNIIPFHKKDHLSTSTLTDHSEPMNHSSTTSHEKMAVNQSKSRPHAKGSSPDYVPAAHDPRFEEF